MGRTHIPKQRSAGDAYKYTASQWWVQRDGAKEEDEEDEDEGGGRGGGWRDKSVW